MFGGYTETADKQRQACNDTWVLDGTGTWSRLQTTGGPPRVRLMGSSGACISRLPHAPWPATKVESR